MTEKLAVANSLVFFEKVKILKTVFNLTYCQTSVDRCLLRMYLGRTLMDAKI